MQYIKHLLGFFGLVVATIIFVFSMVVFSVEVIDIIVNQFGMLSASLVGIALSIPLFLYCAKLIDWDGEKIQEKA